MIKDIIKRVNSKLKIMDISTTFVGDNINKYINSIKTNHNIVLYAEKCNENKEYIELFNPTSEVMLFYLDKYIHIPKDVSETNVIYVIKRLLDETENFECCICYQDANKMLPCSSCGISYCHKCILTMKTDICAICKNRGLEYVINVE